MKSSFWKFWTHAKTEKNALVVMNRLKKLLFSEPRDIVALEYYKGGYVVEFWLDHEQTSREKYIFDLIDQGQNLGGKWTIGCVHSDTQGWGKEVSIVGINHIDWLADTEPLIAARRAQQENRDEEPT